MKTNLLLFALLFVISNLSAQDGVGIGTTMPNSKSILELSSTTKGLLIPRMTSTQRTAIATPPQGLMVFQNNGTTSLGFWYHDGTTWQRFAKASELGAAGSWTVSGNNQYSEVVGNVGIGVNAGINRKFYLKGNAFITHVNAGDLVNGGNVARLSIHAANTGSAVLEFLRSDTTAAGTVSYSSIGNVLNIRHSESTRNMRFYESGKIGIGTGIVNDTAHSTLHIKEGDFATYTTRNGYLMLGPKGDQNLVLTDYEILARNNGAASPLYLQQDGGAVHIGNLGSSTINTRLFITDGDESSLTTHGHILIGPHTSTNMVFDPNEIQARQNGAAATLRLQQDGGALLVQNGALTVATNGFVGIGDITPAVPLEVAGDATFNGTNPTIQLQNASVDKGFFQLSGDNVRIGTNSANDLGSFIVRNNGADRVWVAPNGNVGIGVASPAAKLDVAGGGIRVTRNGEAIAIDGTNPYMQFWNGGVGKFYMQQIGNNLQIASSSGNGSGDILMFADEVAINTGGPAEGYSLSVGGEIICEELRVELQGNGPWPDYVFADEYKLISLDELKTFVDTNKHLPNIPAAAQVESEGFDVGDMNRRLLEKVEELTLYIFQQQEQIDALTQKVNAIKDK